MLKTILFLRYSHTVLVILSFVRTHPSGQAVSAERAQNDHMTPRTSYEPLSRTFYLDFMHTGIVRAVTTQLKCTYLKSTKATREKNVKTVQS